MPPYPEPSAGPRRSAATASPGSVLMALIASAPASSQARATARTSEAAAVSLAMSGRSQARRTAATALAAVCGSSPNALPRDAVGAREVELDGRDARDALEPPRALGELARGLAAQVQDHGDRPARPGGRVPVQHGIDARVLEPDAQQQPRGHLRHARGRVAAAGLEAGPARHDAAEPLEVHEVRHLDAVPERPRGDDDRVRQDQPAARGPPRGCTGRPPSASRDGSPATGSMRRDAVPPGVADADDDDGRGPTTAPDGDGPARTASGPAGSRASRRRTVGVRRCAIPGTARRFGFTGAHSCPSPARRRRRPAPRGRRAGWRRTRP